MDKRKINEIYNKISYKNPTTTEDVYLRSNFKLIDFEGFKQALQVVAVEEHNKELLILKKGWVQNKKKFDQLTKKQIKNDRDYVMIDSYKEVLNQDKDIIKILKRKKHYDIIREYLVHLGLDKRHVYLNKITVIQPFSIREKPSRIAQVPVKKDPYKKYVEKQKKEAPSKRHILEVITNARKNGILKKNAITTPNKKKNKIDSTIPNPMQSYKELSAKKKNIENAKILKKTKRKENELKRKIMEEQLKVRQLKEEKRKARPPPIVTLDSLMRGSLNNFYNTSPNSTANDSTMNFVQNLIAQDSEEKIPQESSLPTDEASKDILEKIPLEDQGETPNFTAAKSPVNIESTTPTGQEQEAEILEQPEAATTVDLVINRKSKKKKFKAILPPDHPHNRKKRIQKYPKNVVNYQGNPIVELKL